MSRKIIYVCFLLLYRPGNYDNILTIVIQSILEAGLHLFARRQQSVEDTGDVYVGNTTFIMSKYIIPCRCARM